MEVAQVPNFYYLLQYLSLFLFLFISFFSIYLFIFFLFVFFILDTTGPTALSQTQLRKPLVVKGNSQSTEFTKVATQLRVVKVMRQLVVVRVLLI